MLGDIDQSFGITTTPAPKTTQATTTTPAPWSPQPNIDQSFVPLTDEHRERVKDRLRANEKAQGR